MSNRVNDLLQKGEKISDQITFSQRYVNATQIIVYILCFCAFYAFVEALVFCLIAVFVYCNFYLKAANQYYITNKRIIRREGLISVDYSSISYQKITDFKLKQNLFERFVTRSGSIYFSSAGSSGFEVKFQNIDKPFKTLKLINELIAESKRKKRPAPKSASTKKS